MQTHKVTLIFRFITSSGLQIGTQPWHPKEFVSSFIYRVYFVIHFSDIHT